MPKNAILPGPGQGPAMDLDEQPRRGPYSLHSAARDMVEVDLLGSGRCFVPPVLADARSSLAERIFEGQTSNLLVYALYQADSPGGHFFVRNGV